MEHSLVSAKQLVGGILRLEFSGNAFIRGITWAMVVAKRNDVVLQGEQHGHGDMETPFPIEPADAYSSHRTIIQARSMDACIQENDLIQNQTPLFISLFHEPSGNFHQFRIDNEQLSTDFIGPNGYAAI
jgi:hypothetical protein